ncbi:MAG: hypothetical protein P4L22_06535 [Candidatus Babeliales bacterium]|nr:hypothetical protein [Candidatus Babeliales bacterium]
MKIFLVLLFHLLINAQPNRLEDFEYKTRQFIVINTDDTHYLTISLNPVYLTDQINYNKITISSYVYKNDFLLIKPHEMAVINLGTYSIKTINNKSIYNFEEATMFEVSASLGKSEHGGLIGYENIQSSPFIEIEDDIIYKTSIKYTKNEKNEKIGFVKLEKFLRSK